MRNVKLSIVEELNKQYYKIKDVAAFLSVTPSTLRFWEKEFPDIKPMRTSSGIRYYTPEDVETLRIIYYLVRTKGLKLEAARAQIAANKKNISRRLEIIKALREVRNDLDDLLSSLNKIRT